MLKPNRFHASAFALTLVGLAAAHAHLDEARPQRNAVVSESPQVVELDFTMAVEIRFSTFKVYRLDVAQEALPSDLSRPEERELMRLNALAAELAQAVLASGDVPSNSVRLGAAVEPESGTSRTVRMQLDDELEPGVYVVLWEVLAIDTHWTNDHLLFVLAP